MTPTPTPASSATVYGSCVGCGKDITQPHAPLGMIGDRKGPLCPDCSYWCDGNVLPRTPSNEIIRFPLACPECGSTELATIERVDGYRPVNGMYQDHPEFPDVHIEWGPSGTEFWWDTAKTIGARCLDCYWHYEGDDWESKLVRAVADDD